MNKQEARDILGDRATWELRHMKKALTSLGGFFNTDEEDLRLDAIKELNK